MGERRVGSGIDWTRTAVTAKTPRLVMSGESGDWWGH